MNTSYIPRRRWIGRAARRASGFCVVAIGLILFCSPGFFSAHAGDRGVFEMEADGAYTMREGDTKALCRNLAVFQAKRTVVEAAEKYFSRRERIALFGRKRDEIVNYTADRIAFNVLQEKWLINGSSTAYQVRLKMLVEPSDFIESEIESLLLEKKEMGESLHEEMEPSISAESPPGYDIARAYRLIRIGKLRPAIIYLDRLQLKYPNWYEIYEVKALAYELHDETSNMKKALQQACELGSPSSCADLNIPAPEGD
ncbi:MAG: hypothetical protein JSW26_00685 [Desulfobacterales bacterium]|nr:MAG: hypothetical protein JSW26_00685 [Desulfobacterales bacterium]